MAQFHGEGKSRSTVRASGASDIRVTVRSELTADLSGASTVYYKGEAVVHDVRASGASAVKKSS